MIKNVPTYQELNGAALNLHFAAWDILIQIYTDLDHYFEYAGAGMEGDDAFYQEYNLSCRSDLQTACTLLQQGAEIGLKAKIAEVSPYLLLIQGGIELKNKKEVQDFYEYRTLDATDLPNAVRIMTNYELSQKFVQEYDMLRRYRNKLVHLGRALDEIGIDEIIELAVNQYVAIWPDTLWLFGYLQKQFSSRTNTFYDGEYESAENNVMIALATLRKRLNPDQFKKITGYTQSKLRYACFACYDNGVTEVHDSELPERATARLDKVSGRLECRMCGEWATVTVGKCIHCNGKILSPEDDPAERRCHSCGEGQEHLVD